MLGESIHLSDEARSLFRLHQTLLDIPQYPISFFLISISQGRQLGDQSVHTLARSGVADPDLSGDSGQITRGEKKPFGEVSVLRRKPTEPRAPHRALIDQPAARALQPHGLERLRTVPAASHFLPILRIMKNRKVIFSIL
jgi:hypothetical protein